MSTAFPPVVFGVAGLGGYAGQIVDLLLSCGEGEAPSVRLAAVTDPAPQRFPEKVAQLAARGVRIDATFDTLLADRAIEAVWLPLPIYLHRAYTERALAAGKAVMCEKPVAGCVDDVDALIAARDRAARPVAIGYQNLYDPATLALKRELLAGAIGQVRSVAVWATWPRTDQYYGRNDWAGALRRGGAWALDSPAHNALAHYINLALFLLGPAPYAAATPTAVEAELYRANPIENYDTIGMRLRVPAPAVASGGSGGAAAAPGEGGASGGAGSAAVLVLFTHACAVTHHPRLTFQGSAGQAHWTFDGPVVIETRAGVRQIPREGQGRTSMVPRFAKLVRGIPDEQVAVATLEASRPQVVAINGASEATPVRQVPESAIVMTTTPDGVLRTIPGIEAAIAHCAGAGVMLHESGRFPWTAPAGQRDLRGYRHFAGPAGWGISDF